MFATLRATTGALALIATLPAAAQAPPPAAPPPTITRAQGEEIVRALFGQLDTNHDGLIDADEQAAVVKAEQERGASSGSVDAVRRMFATAARADGRVALDAFLKTRMAAFDRADTNHDGKLDPAEQQAARVREGMAD